MLQNIYKIDLEILRAINLGWADPRLDGVMLALSSTWMWAPIGCAIVLTLIIRRRWQWVRFVLVMIAIVGTADFVAAEFLKPFFNRLRPCKTWDFVRIVASCGGWDSFPSNHATNSAVAAYALWRYAPRAIGCLAVAGAAAVSLSRVYLGVHYPSDVLGGMTFGAASSWAVLTYIYRPAEISKM